MRFQWMPGSEGQKISIHVEAQDLSGKGGCIIVIQSVEEVGVTKTKPSKADDDVKGLSGWATLDIEL